MPEPATPPVSSSSEVPAPAGIRHRVRSGGTPAMLLATLGSALGAYLFQVIGGRALGADAFAPVSVMWTVLFLGFTIFLIPVEQFVIRRLALGRGRAEALAGSWRAIVAVVAVPTLLAMAFTVTARGQLLAGDIGYLPVAAVMFPTHGLMVLGRGFLAGRWRFNAYGAVVALDAGGKLAGAVVVVSLGWGSIALSWALVLSPLLVLVVRPFGKEPGDDGTEVDRTGESGRRFMGGYLIATGASQTVLAAGPLVVGALGAAPAAISIFFVTTTLFRGPMTASYNLIARVLPRFTSMAAAGRDQELNHWARRLGIGGSGAAVIVGAIASVLGPPVVSLLYGDEFRPSATLAALAAAAVIAGMVGLATTQILVARGHTDRMAMAWLVALAAAALTIVVVPSDPGIRVAAGFLAGEVVALLGLTFAALFVPAARRPGP